MDTLELVGVGLGSPPLKEASVRLSLHLKSTEIDQQVFTFGMAKKAGAILLGNVEIASWKSHAKQKIEAI